MDVEVVHGRLAWVAAPGIRGFRGQCALLLGYDVVRYGWGFEAIQGVQMGFQIFIV
jgi:hypothetical protein